MSRKGIEQDNPFPELTFEQELTFQISGYLEAFEDCNWIPVNASSSAIEFRSRNFPIPKGETAHLSQFRDRFDPQRIANSVQVGSTIDDWPITRTIEWTSDGSGLGRGGIDRVEFLTSLLDRIQKEHLSQGGKVLDRQPNG